LVFILNENRIEIINKEKNKTKSSLKRKKYFIEIGLIKKYRKERMSNILIVPIFIKVKLGLYK
jgi:hypothetical protein